MFAWVACVGMTGLPPGRADAVVCVDANKDGRCSIYAAGDVLSFSLANTVHRFEAFLRSRASYSRRQICSVIDGTVIGDPFYQAYASEHKHDGVALEHVEGRIFADWMALWAYEVDNLTRVHDGIQRLYADREWRDNAFASNGAETFGSFILHELASRGHYDIEVGQVSVDVPMPYMDVSATDAQTVLMTNTSLNFCRNDEMT
jgi:hypothetical protein